VIITKKGLRLAAGPILVFLDIFISHLLGKMMITSAWKDDENILKLFSFLITLSSLLFISFHFLSLSFTFCHSQLQKVIISNPLGKVMIMCRKN
jgi:hypothetical protein